MINLHDIRYARLGTSSLDDSVAYAKTVLGLEEVRRSAKRVYLRSDDRDHTLCYFEGDPADHTVAFEVLTADALDDAAATLEQLGHAVKTGSAAECDERHVRSFINFRDPSGNSIDLVLRPHHSGRRYFPGRDAGITGFSHIGLCSNDPVRDERFWTQVCSAKVSDRIGDAALLRVDGVHHKIALFPSQRNGIQHINHQVASLDDLMRSYYLLQANGVRIVFGPGRHPTSGAMFLYFEGPHGMVFEYSTGVRVFTPEEDARHLPRQFPATPESYCMWGSKPDIAEFRNAPA